MDTSTSIVVVAVVSAVLAVVVWEVLRLARRRRVGEPLREGEKGDRDESSLAKKDVKGAAHAVRLYAGEVEMASIEALAARASGTRLVAAPPGVRAHVSSLIQHGVGIGSTARTLLSSAVTMRFASEVTCGLADGSLAIMKSAQGGLRGMAVDSTGKIVGQVSLDAIGKGAAAATAIWQVAAMVTAQKFLADIDAKLGNIERGVAEVKEWLEDERQAELVGQAQKLRSYARTLAEPVSQEEALAMLTSLEHMDLQARQRMAADAALMGRIREGLTPGQLSGDLEQDLETLTGSAGEYERAHQRYLLGGAVRLAATQVRGALPTSLRRSAQLAEEVAAELNAHAAGQDELGSRAERTAQAMKERWYQWEDTGKEARAKMRTTFRDLDERLIASSTAAHGIGASLVGRMSAQLSAGDRGLELVVQLRDGEVVDVNEVQPEERPQAAERAAVASPPEGSHEAKLEEARSRWPALTDAERGRLIREGALDAAGGRTRGKRRR